MRQQQFGKIIGRIRNRQAKAASAAGWGASPYMDRKAIDDERKNYAMRRQLDIIGDGFSGLTLAAAP